MKLGEKPLVWQPEKNWSCGELWT